ncbi:acyltransferase [Maribellus sp. CM-23]|uniref:acyltransferase n=1 Tax=Maribellus sp. CM-23 TaxID=2781026 RepID=UPI001F2CD937|nr:acyltransferase [Maribellus sp. CM-23]
MGLKIYGTPRYIGKDVKFDNFSKVELGDRIVISNDCFFLTHDYSVTTALISIGEKPKTDIALERPIKIGNNVFIGKRSIIMPNTTIEDNVIIGAGTVVRGVIPKNSIAIGNPCTVIGNIQEQALKWKKYLDSDKIRQD